MSARSTITISDQYDTFHIYRHGDGYPSAVLPDLAEALTFAWPLPRYEAGDVTAAIVRGFKTGGGNVYFTSDASAHWDREYHYDILGVTEEPKLDVNVRLSKITAA